MRARLTLSLVGFALANVNGLDAQERIVPQLAAEAREILKSVCHRCHGDNGTIEGGFSFVLDRQQLVARKLIAPGSAVKSRLIRRVESDEMPPEGESPRLTKEQIAILTRWVDAGALDFNPPKAPRAFIAATDIIALMHDDLKQRDESDRRFVRYLTLTHLYNAGRSDEELQSYRHGVAKLLNSLSWGRQVVAPVPVDAARTILRIDLRDYKWTASVWDALSAADPYGLVYSNLNPKVRALYADTGSALPYVRGDWFVSAASRPPLYHEILQLPTTEKQLEALLHVNVEDDIRTGQAARAGFNGSAVSRNNRLIERHESSYGYYWKSYDFASNVDRQNLFAHPLGPGTAANEFKHDGGESIFSLPNGFQGYMLVTGDGRRIDKGPTAIVSDPKRPDRAVENGLSCMSCHVRGLLPKDDQIRAHVESNPGAFTKRETDAVLALYPLRLTFQSLVEADAARFRDAAQKAGIPPSIGEPIVALATLFESELDLPLAAAEAQLPPDEFQKLLKQSPTLARVLGSLQTPGGTVQREAFAKVFGTVARTTKIGTPLKKPATYATTSAPADGLVAGNKWIGLGVCTKGPDLGKGYQRVVLRILERKGPDFTAKWEYTSYNETGTFSGSSDVFGRIDGESVEWKNSFEAKAQLLDGALVVTWENPPNFGEHVLVPEATFNDRNQLAGRYRISAEGKFIFELSLAGDGSATKSLAPKVAGAWQPLKGGALVVWSEGWRDVLTVEPGHLVKRAYEPGTSVVGKPVNPGIATKVVK